MAGIYFELEQFIKSKNWPLKKDGLLHYSFTFSSPSSELIILFSQLVLLGKESNFVISAAIFIAFMSAYLSISTYEYLFISLKANASNQANTVNIFEILLLQLANGLILFVAFVYTNLSDKISIKAFFLSNVILAYWFLKIHRTEFQKKIDDVRGFGGIQ